MDLYELAYSCALKCVRNGYSREIWIAPIPDKDKDAIWNRAVKTVERERLEAAQPTLFKELA